jgi:aspartate racemase
MIVKEEILPSRMELSGTQRAQLEERLQRARQMTARPPERSSIPRRSGSEAVPLSFAQERLWFLDQLEPSTAVYNVCQAVRLSGTLDVIALEKAFNEIVRRHEILRTNFVASEGRAVQVIAPTRTIELALVDLSGGRDGTANEECQRRLQQESRRPFDFARDLLVRTLLVRVSATEHILMLTMHHIISDGWSIGIIFRELAALYAAYCKGDVSPLPELPIQFADFVTWEREVMQGTALEKPLAYWKEQLGGTLPVLEFPIDHPRSLAPMSRGAAQSVTLPRSLAQALKALGQREGATLFMTLLASFQVLLNRWTGEEDIVVGSVVAGRRKVELEKLIGFFVNTLVFRGDLRGNPTFRELLARVRETSLGAMANQDVPFERLVKELRPDRTLSRNPLFQVMFVLQNAPLPPMQLPGLTLEPVDVDTGTTKFDLTLSMMETAQGLRAALEYNADLFEPGTIVRLLGCFQTLLEGIVADPDQRVSRLPLLTPAERHQVLSDWNQTGSNYPREKTMVQLFAEQVTQTPTAIAVQFQDHELTYGELDAQSDRLAQRLRSAGVRTETLVGVCLDRSVELIVSLIAILKAGGAYVSLDPAYPRERLAFMLKDTRAPVLVTQRSLIQNLPPHDAVAILVDEMELQRARTEASFVNGDEPGCDGLGAGLGPENLAYVSYTSGSTGRPKGVCIPHRGVVRLVKNSDFAQFSRDDVFLQFAPVAFDASILEIWGPLLNGGRLVISPPGPTSLAELGALIEKRGITTLWLTAGLFHQMVDEQIDRLRNVRQLLAGGDVLSVAHVVRALEQLPRTQLINGYGPTENTTFTCCARLTAPPPPGRSVPIGRPIANTQVFILDRELQPVPMGVPGELFTGGDGLARGYLNRPDLTQEKFIVHPFSQEPGARLYRTGDLARWLSDGSVEFLGRIDRQVKIRGFRVEPGEIEAMLATHPAVKKCAVIVREDASGAKCLAAYIVAKQLPAPAADTWRSFLEERLPEYLVPSYFVGVDVLPLTPNGKVDVAALPAFDGRRPELPANYVAPRDAVETRLAEIWSAVLGVGQIGVYDRFFDLGGHSLLAVRMAAQVEQQFGKKIPVAAIFQHRTIEQLAKLLRENGQRYTPVSSIVEIQGHGSQPPVYFVHGVGGGMFWGYSNLAKHLGTDQPIYAFKSRGLEGLPEWPTIEEIAANYLADLRTHQPNGPYLLGGYCFGGVVAFEMARQLTTIGEHVDLLALINCSPPNTEYDRPRRNVRWRFKFLRNLFYWIGCFLFSWTMKERVEFVRWKSRVLRKKATGTIAQDATEMAVADLDELLNLADYSQQQRELWQSHIRALMAYRPKPYDGHVTLFRTRGHALFTSFDEHYGWGELVRGGITMEIMPGGHGNVLDEPHVRAVAKAFSQRVRESAVDRKGVLR